MPFLFLVATLAPATLAASRVSAASQPSIDVTKQGPASASAGAWFGAERGVTAEGGSVPFPAGAVAFDPAGERGVINDGTGLSERLRWLGPKSLSAPLPLPFDRIGDPVRSPDGRTIVVPGVTGLGASGGAERANQSWGLWELDGQPARLTLVDIVTGRRVAARDGTAGEVARTSDHTVATMLRGATNRIVILDVQRGLRDL